MFSRCEVARTMATREHPSVRAKTVSGPNGSANLLSETIVLVSLTIGTMQHSNANHPYVSLERIPVCNPMRSCEDCSEFHKV